MDPAASQACWQLTAQLTALGLWLSAADCMPHDFGAWCCCAFDGPAQAPDSHRPAQAPASDRPATSSCFPSQFLSIVAVCSASHSCLSHCLQVLLFSSVQLPAKQPSISLQVLDAAPTLSATDVLSVTSWCLSHHLVSLAVGPLSCASPGDVLVMLQTLKQLRELKLQVGGRLLNAQHVLEVNGELLTYKMVVCVVVRVSEHHEEYRCAYSIESVINIESITSPGCC